METLRWDAIAEAATAVVELPAQKSGPDMVGWMPGRMEWLLISRSDGGRSFMRPLPGSDARDAIVAALREQLGSRWAGERLPLQSAQKRFRIARRGDGLKYAAILASVLALLLLVVMVALVVGSVLYLPAMFALGAWMFHRGLAGLRDALHIANTPTAKVSSAAMGLVELEGRAVAEQPSPAAVSDRPSVWWDVDVEAWYRERRGKGRWRQVMARHGGTAGLMLEDATGRVPVWLRDADLLLQVHTWESGKDVLPPGGVALLEGTGFAWSGGSRLRVHERRMERVVQIDRLVELEAAITQDVRDLHGTQREGELVSLLLNCEHTTDTTAGHESDPAGTEIGRIHGERIDGAPHRLAPPSMITTSG